MKLVITYQPAPKTIKVECPKELEFLAKDDEKWTNDEYDLAYGTEELQNILIKIFKDNKIDDVGELDWLKETMSIDIFDYLGIDGLCIAEEG